MGIDVSRVDSVHSDALRARLPHGSSITTVVGTVKVTAFNTGRSQTFVDDYEDRRWITPQRSKTSRAGPS
jgi:hypothetical protein